MGSKEFAYTGGWQQFKVPKGVKLLTVTLQGGGSADVHGGRVSGKLKVVPNQVLFVLVGRAGRPNAGETGGAAAFGGGAAGGTGRGGNGGYGGGGASAIRRSSLTGTILCAAGGAGGTSGDGGKGGQGGAAIGENGFPGSGVGVVGNATGGTAIQGGNGGTSGLGVAYSGQNAPDTALGTAGGGGGPALPDTVAGGGGGGGYRPGGGGQAGTLGVAPAGGGGGGSNYTGALSGFASARGKGGTGNGAVTLSWVNPPPANQPPSPPTDVKVGGKSAEVDQVTHSMGSLTISAKIDDPNAGQKVRLVVVYSAQSDFSSGVKTVTSPAVAQAKRATVHLNGLVKATLYHARLYTRDSHNKLSTNYNSISFWTNRPPLEPTLNDPPSGATVAQLSSVVFNWTHQDPDGTSGQHGFEIRWRLASSPLVLAGEWTTTRFENSAFNTYVADPGTFKANLVYEWQVRTKDPQGTWGPWSFTSAFFVSGEALAPLPLFPAGDEAIDVTVPVELAWVFRDPDQGDTQSSADIRWRVVGTTDWITRLGDGGLPGDVEAWVLPPDTFVAGQHYEWQVRTTDTLSSAVSDWSETERFWATVTPGSLAPGVVTGDDTSGGPVLGEGNNRAWVYDRGGRIRRGEITPLAKLVWGRTRDDIFTGTFTTNGLGEDNGAFYSQIHTWMHEIVVFRDGERVFEGPITRIQDGTGEDGSPSMIFEAKDVMAYPYRRIMRQGYNDSYHIVNGVVQGQFSVVERATKIIQNALAPDDPNLLPYLSSFNFPDDAGQSRVVPSYTKTAWEEIDDMAANSGLDYTALGRRILLWDTHRPIGRLPEMRNEHFSDAPILTEYGMSLATHYGVTNGSGIFGSANAEGVNPYGLVELLASAFGETDADATDVLTSAAKAELEKTFNQQAERNIAGRFPAPVLVRVPDNSALSSSAPVGINDLVPGVWIPLRAKGGCREVAQWQKLDQMTVTQDASGEKVTVVMSPAPHGGADPDAEGSGEDDAE